MRALAERAAVKRAKRKTPVQPSQQMRRAKSRKSTPGRAVNAHAYLVAIRRGSDKADRIARQEQENKIAEAEGREPVIVPKAVPANERIVPSWHPHQLRHSAATAVRKAFGLEAAQVVLGHSSADITQTYAERNLSLAQRVAAECG